MAGNGFLDVSVDIEAAQQALSGTSKSLKSIQRQVLGAIAKGTAKAIKSGIASTTTRRTGELLKAYGYKVKKDGSGATVYPKARAMKATNHLILAKAVTLSYGAEITPRKGRDFLQVNGDGYYARPKAVRIAPRGFIQAGEKYAESGQYEGEIQKIIDREIDKYWG